MAEAKKDVKRVTTETVTVSLTLSGEEASVLHAILMKTGGHKDLSPRKHADSIRRALEVAGVYRGEVDKRLSSGSINFQDYGDGAYVVSSFADAVRLSDNPFTFLNGGAL